MIIYRYCPICNATYHSGREDYIFQPPRRIERVCDDCREDEDEPTEKAIPAGLAKAESGAAQKSGTEHREGKEKAYA